MQKKIELKLAEKLEHKKIYNVFVDDVDTNFIGLEIFNDGTTKRYPFSEKEGRIIQKYKSIRCLTTTKGKRPGPGFSINRSRGFGFTSRKVSDLFEYFQTKLPHINEVVFVADRTAEIKDNKLFITISDFHKIKREIKRLEEEQKKETEVAFQKILSNLLPLNIFTPGKKRYIPGSLARYLDDYSNIKLSKSDEARLEDLFVNSELSTEAIVSTKTKLEIIYFEDVIEEFNRLLQQATSTQALEEKWHNFFKEYPWIFSQIFSFPAVYFQDKLNVGGRNIKGGSDKIADFLYRNKITNNITFIEIKTHLTPLMNDSPYRKPDIYSVNSKLSGAIVQVLDQKNKLLKNYHSKIGSSAKSLNSTCVVIAGQTKSLQENGQQESFELFRWSNKDVVIVTFDELLEKIEILLSVLEKARN